MQSNMIMKAQVIKQKRWKLHGNISRNGHGKAIIGRYGGCFEEDIKLQKNTSVMIHVCHIRSCFLSCMYIHDDFMTESR